MQRKILTIVLGLGLLTCACRQSSNAGKSETQNDTLKYDNAITPQFNSDSAYAYVKQQVDFGTRVPGSAGHKKCEKYIVDELNRHGADTVILQSAEVTAFNGDSLPITNILAQFNRENNYRVLLAAHYDTRPWADNESSDENRRRPILGANDGASGVGVLLEVARLLAEYTPQIGVDLLFVDAEDYGDASGWDRKDDTWCLGTQYWVGNMPYNQENKPAFGIVLDMVGGLDARFHREYYSNKHARSLVDKVWAAGANAGFADKFINEVGGSLVDDHVFINEAGIPCIDIVECNNAITRSFPPTWHTLNDDMSSIDKRSLLAAGQTVLNVLYGERNFR